jgi:spoIIIJ-associated protein
MEWVQTTGRSVEEAVEAALDELGVHEEDVEVEVLEEPKAGFLGRFGGSEARVRVRLKPISREKPQDRRKGRGRASGRRPEAGTRTRNRSGRSPEGAGRGRGRGGSGRSMKERAAPAAERDRGEEAAAVEHDDVPVEEQAEAAEEFVVGLVTAMGLQGEIDSTVDDDTVEIRVEGDGLGLLVGPKGATITAIEELTRAVVQREAGGHAARIRVDVAGYRAKRRAALEVFTRKVVEEVLESGEERALEPMGSVDRKTVHDAVNEIDGVETSSEGEDPRRYVVIRPA